MALCCGVNPEGRGLTAGESIRTADVLLDAGIDIDAPAFVEGSWRATPRYCMWAAVNRGNAAAIRLLVRSGADDPTNEEGPPLLAAVDYQDKSGRTPLHCALKKRRDTEFVKMLVESRSAR